MQSVDKGNRSGVAMYHVSTGVLEEHAYTKRKTNTKTSILEKY